MKKVGRNDKCPCGSNKKYKICCFHKEYDMKQKIQEKYFKGQSESSEKVQRCLEFFRNEYKDHIVIDISNDLNNDTYRLYQTKNYTNKIIMVAEKKSNNNEVFSTRSKQNEDMMVLYRGSYRVFDHQNLIKVKESLKKMIEKRLADIKD